MFSVFPDQLFIIIEIQNLIADLDLLFIFTPFFRDFLFFSLIILS